MTTPTTFPSTPRLLGPTDGDLLGEVGNQDRFLISDFDTDGRCSVVEHILGPKTMAAPMHRHTREDEFTFVLEGSVGAVLDGQVVVAHAGDLLFKPRGQWHTFWNDGDTPARMLELISPAGLEQLFRTIDGHGGFPEPDELAALAASYGLAVDMEATTGVAERHGLEF